LNYQDILKKSLGFIWKYKFLWFFGFFLSQGNPFVIFNFGFPDGFERQAKANSLPYNWPDKRFESFNWVQEHLGLVSLIILGSITLYFLFLILAFISEGGLIGAALGQASDTEPGFKASFKLGLKYFWKMVGIHLAVTIPLIIAFIAIAVPLAIVIISLFSKSISIGMAIGLLILLIILLILFFVSTIPVGIILIFARRYVIDQNLAVFSSIKNGFNLFKNNIGESLMVWFINLIVRIVAGIALSIVVLITIFPLAFILSGRLGANPPPGQIGIFIMVLLPAVLFLKFIGGVVETFSSSFWTFGYFELKQLGEEAKAD
jgi:hypothetical protein